MANVTERIEAFTLQNAVRFGKAVTGRIIPKIIGEFPEVKKDIPGLKKQIDLAVEKVNKLSAEKALAQLQELAPELLEKKPQKKRELPELANAVQGKVVTRLPPEPSKYNHLGHALTFIINAIYAQRYGGKVVVRFEDCNPEKVTQEFVNEMSDDIQNYLGIDVADIHFVSDDMELLFKYTEELIHKQHMYMCFCAREDISANRRSRTECECRSHSLDKNQTEWKRFKKGDYVNGECVLRFKGDMQSKNTVMLDPVMWRAITKPHFRTGDKYKIWPMYDFYSGIEEHICGVTHVIRSNEFDLRVELQKKIQELLGLPQPEFIHYGRFNITGATTKGREIRAGIEHGEYIGWDDPRLVTLRALKRRGIQKEAYWQLVKDLGLSPYQVNLDFSMLAAKNRDFIDATSNRYSFIEDPEEITVENVEPHSIKLHLHPDKKDGKRNITSSGKYLVSPGEKAKFGSKKIRLMGDITFQEQDGKYVFLSKDVSDGHDKIINWLSADPDQTIPVEVMMPDATIKEGLGESGVRDVKVGELVQFERFGFCRLDVVEDDGYRFWYTHD